MRLISVGYLPNSSMQGLETFDINSGHLLNECHMKKDFGICFYLRSGIAVTQAAIFRIVVWLDC